MLTLQKISPMKMPKLLSQTAQYLKTKAIDPIASYFKQGLDTHKLSQSVAAGMVIGTIPVIGVSSVMATLVGLRYRMFTALIMLITYIIYPLQMLLILPYMKLGSYLVGAETESVNVTAIFSKLFKHPLSSLAEFGFLILGGLIAWAVLSVPVYFASYYSTSYLCKVKR